MLLIPKDSTNVSVTIRIVDSSDGTPETGVVWNTAGIDMEYRREGAVSTDITEATLSALTDAHSDGGFLHVGNGYYRLDVPDAAFATGVNGVLIHGTVTGMVVMGEYVQLTDVDLFDATPAVNVTQVAGQTASAAATVVFDDLSTIETVTTAIAATGTGLSAIPWNASWDAEVQSEVTAALNAYDPPTRAELTTDIGTIVTDLDDIKGTSFIKDTHSLIDIKTETALIVADTDVIDDATSGLVKIASDVAEILTDTGTTIPGTITTIDNEIATIDTVVDAIKVTTDKIDLSSRTIITGTVDASPAPSTSSVAGTLLDAEGNAFTMTEDSQLKGRTIIFQHDTTGAGLRNQASDITGGTAADDAVTFTTVTTLPVTGDTFIII